MLNGRIIESLSPKNSINPSHANIFYCSCHPTWLLSRDLAKPLYPLGGRLVLIDSIKARLWGKENFFDLIYNHENCL
jgi:hypothetical protein